MLFCLVLYMALYTTHKIPTTYDELVQLQAKAFPTMEGQAAAAAATTGGESSPLGPSPTVICATMVDAMEGSARRLLSPLLDYGSPDYPTATSEDSQSTTRKRSLSSSSSPESDEMDRAMAGLDMV